MSEPHKKTKKMSRQMMFDASSTDQQNELPEWKKRRLYTSEATGFKIFGDSMVLSSMPGVIKLGKMYSDKKGSYMTTQALQIPSDSFLTLLTLIDIFTEGLRLSEQNAQVLNLTKYNTIEELEPRKPKPNNFVVKIQAIFDPRSKVHQMEIARYMINDISSPEKDFKLKGGIIFNNHFEVLDFIKAFFENVLFSAYNMPDHRQAIDHACRMMSHMDDEDCNALFDGWLAIPKRGLNVLEQLIRGAHQKFPSRYGYKSLELFFKVNLTTIYCRILAGQAIRSLQDELLQNC